MGAAGDERQQRRWDHRGLWGPPSAQIWLTLKSPARKCRFQAPPQPLVEPSPSARSVHLSHVLCAAESGPCVRAGLARRAAARGSRSRTGGGASLAATVCEHAQDPSTGCRAAPRRQTTPEPDCVGQGRIPKHRRRRGGEQGGGAGPAAAQESAHSAGRGSRTQLRARTTQNTSQPEKRSPGPHCVVDGPRGRGAE